MAAAFPGGKKVTVKEVKAAFAARNAPVRVTDTQLKSWISRENRQRRGEPECQQITVQDMKFMVDSWVEQQSTTFTNAALTDLRIVGNPVHTVKQVCIAWTARGFLNHMRQLPRGEPVCLTVDGKQRIATSGAVVATVGIMGTSHTPRNTTLDREHCGKKVQMQLRTSTVQPLMQAYIDCESNENWTWVFEAAVELVQKEFAIDLPERVIQVQADFNDSIEAARRHVFPKSRPANDYPHMTRATHATLSKKALAGWRDRVLRVVRCARHLPTLELFSAVWCQFMSELEASGQKEVVGYLRREYIREVSVGTVSKMFKLHPSLEPKLLWADYWAGVFGTHPGSATGTQTLEAFHSFWQRRIQDQARAAPNRILEIMQGLYAGPWKVWMLEDQGKACDKLGRRTGKGGLL